MGKTRKNNKYRKRNNIASRKQGKINFLKGLRGGSFFGGAKEQTLQSSLMTGGSIDRLPVPETFEKFMEQWRLYYVSAHGEIDKRMFIVPENTYILNLATAGFPCDINKVSVNYNLVVNPNKSEDANTKLKKIFSALKGNTFLKEQIIASNGVTVNHEVVYKQSIRSTRANSAYSIRKYNSNASKSLLDFYYIDPNIPENKLLIKKINSDPLLLQYLKIIQADDYYIFNTDIYGKFKEYEKDSKKFNIETIKGATYITFDMNDPNLNTYLSTAPLEEQIKIVSSTGKLQTVYPNNKLIHIFQKKNIPFERHFETIAKRSDAQKTISFYEPGDILYDTNLYFKNNLTPPLFLTGAYNIPIPFDIVNNVFNENIAIRYYKSQKLDLFKIHPELDPGAKSIFLTQPTADALHIKLMNIPQNLLQNEMFRNPVAAGGAGGAVAINKTQMRLSEVLNYLPSVSIATGGGSGANLPTLNRLIIVDSCRVPIQEYKLDYDLITRARRKSIATRTFPNVPRLNATGAPIIKNGKPVTKSIRKLNKQYLEKILSEMLKYDTSVGKKIWPLNEAQRAELNSLIVDLKTFIGYESTNSTNPSIPASSVIEDDELDELMKGIYKYISYSEELYTLLYGP